MKPNQKTNKILLGQKQQELTISEDFLYSNNIIIRKISLPAQIKGFCTRKGDNNIICINQDLNESLQIETLYHEINHIVSNHLDSEESTIKIENA